MFRNTYKKSRFRNPLLVLCPLCQNTTQLLPFPTQHSKSQSILPPWAEYCHLSWWDQKNSVTLNDFGKKHKIKWWSCLPKVPCSGNPSFLSTAASLPILLSFPQFSATFACSAFLRHFQLWPPPSWRYPTSRRWIDREKFDSRHLIKLWKLYKEGSKYRLT